MKSWHETTCSLSGCGGLLLQAGAVHPTCHYSHATLPWFDSPAPWCELNLFSPGWVLQDKIQAFWNITKRELGDHKAELRVKDKELEEAQVGGCCSAAC